MIWQGKGGLIISFLRILSPVNPGVLKSILKFLWNYSALIGSAGIVCSYNEYPGNKKRLSHMYEAASFYWGFCRSNGVTQANLRAIFSFKTSSF